MRLRVAYVITAAAPNSLRSWIETRPPATEFQAPAAIALCGTLSTHEWAYRSMPSNRAIGLSRADECRHTDAQCMLYRRTFTAADLHTHIRHLRGRPLPKTLPGSPKALPQVAYINAYRHTVQRGFRADPLNLDSRPANRRAESRAPRAH